MIKRQKTDFEENKKNICRIFNVILERQQNKYNFLVSSDYQYNPPFLVKLRT